MGMGGICRHLKNYVGTGTCPHLYYNVLRYYGRGKAL